MDHPRTQRWKRWLLERAGIAVPPALTFIPLDLEETTLDEGLQSLKNAGDDEVFFSWLGVTPYLSREAVFNTLGFIASMLRGSVVIFDYLVDPSSLSPGQRARFDALARRVAAIGEPWKSSFVPADLVETLRAMGFHSVGDLCPEEINRRYFALRSDWLRVGSLSHIVKAVA